MKLNELIEELLKFKEQGYEELEVSLNCEYDANEVELMERKDGRKWIDIG